MFLTLSLINKSPATITVTQKPIALGTAQTEQNPTAWGALPMSLLLFRYGVLGSCEECKVLSIEFNPGYTAPSCQIRALRKWAEKDLTLIISLPSPDSSSWICVFLVLVAAPEQKPSARMLTWSSCKIYFLYCPLWKKYKVLISVKSLCADLCSFKKVTGTAGTGSLLSSSSGWWCTEKRV